MQQTLKNIELLIFDLDGTLVNSLPDLTDGVNYALKKLGKDTISEKQTAKFIGDGLQKLLVLATNNKDEAYFEKARNYFMEYYDSNFVNRSNYYEGVREVLSHFSNKKKVVFSNKLHHYTVAILEQLGLDHFFVKIMGAQPNVFKAKPSAEGINIILKELNIDSKKVLMIGDSTHDIHAGQEAGVKTCGVTYGYRPKELLMAAKPDLLINHINELKGLID